MKPNPVHRLPAALENAVQRIKLAAREAVERTIESLGLAALASNNVFQRDGLLGAQFELNRKSAVFALSFNEALDQRVLREVAPRAGTADAGETAWDALSLVDDREVEIQVAAERFGLEIAHACEWELRELGAYVTALLGAAGGETDRNPLRPDVVGNAMIRAIDATSERAEVRKVLTAELGRSMAGLLRAGYKDIVADLRGAGVQPAGLSVRTAGTRSGTSSSFDAPAGTGAGAESLRPESSFDSRYGQRRAAPSGFAPSTRSGGMSGRGGSATLGQVDPALMSLIRRLAFSDGGGDVAASDWGAGPSAGGAPLPNLIRAHRDELRQASTGSLDHMVIDVIGSLFDQILSDPRVPPQMARQIARLQLPVLRAALGDPSFFSSRRHPVRRFVNRIASLGAAFEDFDGDGAKAFLAKVRALVQEVVEGDFDQIEVYEHKLTDLEAFIAEEGKREVQAQGDAAELLSAKEDELRLRTLYAQQLQGELKDLAAPAFVRDFISQVWSQVLLKAAERDGADSERVRRLRQTGRDLFVSVQPKTSPAQRKSFLAELPPLMKALGEGMDLIQWPAERRRAFFGQLLPTHAESLKATQGPRTLEINLLAKQVEVALDKPLPSREALRAAPLALPVLTDVIDTAVAAPQFSADEAARIGLVEEAAIDWDGKVDIDLGAEPTVTPADLQIAGLPTPAASGGMSEPLEPVSGKALAEHVQIGFAYQMHLDDKWQKVRLVHVSPGRSFFVFNRGARHQQTISLTQRMLVRLCETGRLRAFESAYLLERATARARRQLAGVSA
jgi:hypothetical protein